MALAKNKISVAFNAGVDTKTDPKQVRGKLLVLQNAYFQTLQKIRKRNGYIALPSLGAGVALCTYTNELITFDGQSVYSYSANQNTMVNKGGMPLVSLATSTVIRNTFQQTTQDSAINGTLQCFTWTDSSGGIKYSIFDTATGQSIVNDASVPASNTGAYAKVLAIGSYFVITFFDSGAGQLYYCAINTSTPTLIGTATQISSDMQTAAGFVCWDATIINGKIFIAYGATSNNVGIYSLSSALVLSTETTQSTTNSASTLTIFGDASFNVWVSYAITGSTGVNTTVSVFIKNSSMGAVLAPTQIDAFQVGGAGPTINTMTGIVTSTTGTIYYEVDQTPVVAGDGINFIKKNTCTTGGTVGTAGVFNRGVGLASKAFLYSGSYYLLTAASSNLQPTYFLIRQDGVLAGKLAPSSGGGYADEPILPEMNLVSSGLFQTASLIKDSLTVQNGVIATQTGVQSAEFMFVSSAPSKFLLGNNLHVMGAIPYMYDGGGPVEHSFSLYPEGLYTTWNSSSPTTGGGVGVGQSVASVNQKQYVAVYEWTDNQGQLHQSAPSIPITVSLPTPTAMTTFVGTLNSSGSPPHGGNTITYTSGTTPAVGQYVNMIVGTGGDVSFPWNATVLSVVGSTITLSASFFIVSSSQTFMVTVNPLSLYFLEVFTPSAHPGFAEVNAFAGQILLAPPGKTSNYPANTYFTTIGSGAYNSTSGQWATNNPPTGLGNTNQYYSMDQYAIPLGLPTLKVTDKKNVSIAVYATENNGTIFYRCSSPTSLIYNDPTVDFITSFSDTTPDLTLIGNEQLYTTSGEVDNIAPPAALFSFTYKSRSILIPSESTNGPSFWFSKQVIPGTPVEYNDAFTQNIDARIGSITAGAALDDKMIFFGPTSKFYVVGDGPSSNGQNNDFTQANKIAGNTGCSNFASVIEIKDGLMYQDPTKGIWLLDRSLQEHYIGADVEAFNGYTVTSAELVEGVTQVRFTLNNGTALVYDYVVGQWSVFLNHSAVDATVFQGLYTFLNASGAVWQESVGTFTDPGTTAILLGLLTGWIQMDDIQGFQRLYQMLFLGSYYSPHSITCTTFLNFQAAAAQTTVAQIPSSGPPQFRLFMDFQKCEAIQLQLQESQPNGSFGQGFDLSNLQLLVGQKLGAFKVPAAVSYG